MDDCFNSIGKRIACTLFCSWRIWKLSSFLKNLTKKIQRWIGEPGNARQNGRSGSLLGLPMTTDQTIDPFPCFCSGATGNDNRKREREVEPLLVDSEPEMMCEGRFLRAVSRLTSHVCCPPYKKRPSRLTISWQGSLSYYDRTGS